MFKKQGLRTISLMIVLSLLLIWEEVVFFLIGVGLLGMIELLIAAKKMTLSRFESTSTLLLLLTCLALAIIQVDIT